LESVRPSVTWTEESEDHIARHDVYPHEVEEVLFSRPRYERRSRDETTACFGQTDAGRYLVVVICEALDGGTGIVTAREMDDAEKRQFKKKGR
jgi:uncharacterized DUF497 family protein